MTRVLPGLRAADFRAPGHNARSPSLGFYHGRHRRLPRHLAHARAAHAACSSAASRKPRCGSIRLSRRSARRCASCARRLNDPILVRGKSGMVPTEYGESLLASAQRVLREVDFVATPHGDFDPGTLAPHVSRGRARLSERLLHADRDRAVSRGGAACAVSKSIR